MNRLNLHRLILWAMLLLFALWFLVCRTRLWLS